MCQRSVSGDHLLCFLFPAHPLLTLIAGLLQKVRPLVAVVDNCSFILIYVGEGLWIIIYNQENSSV